MLGVRARDIGDSQAVGDRLWRELQLRSEEHTSELQSLAYLVCRLLLEKKKKLKISFFFINTQHSITSIPMPPSSSSPPIIISTSITSVYLIANQHITLTLSTSHDTTHI